MVYPFQLSRRGLPIVTWSIIGTVLLLGGFVPAAFLQAQPAPATRPIGRFPRPLTLGEGPTCSLDATVYELRLPPEQIGRIDMDALAKAAANPANFEKALADLGASKPLYRASQSVRLAGDSITIGTSAPVVVGSRKTNTGQVMNTVRYQNVGAVFSIAGKPAAEGRIELDMSIEVAALTEGSVAIAPEMKPPLTRRATILRKSSIDPGKPFVAVSLDAATLDPSGKAVGYIARIALGPPQPATQPAKAEP